MRNDTDRWDALALDEMRTQSALLTIAPLSFARLTLISGANVLQQAGVPRIGWPDIAARAPFALVLRRDRVLIVDGPEEATGWDEGRGWAISDASEAYGALELRGAAALDALSRGGELSLEAASPSVVRRLFGLDVILFRYEAADKFALFVPRAHLSGLFKSLEAAHASLNS